MTDIVGGTILQRDAGGGAAKRGSSVTFKALAVVCGGEMVIVLTVCCHWSTSEGLAHAQVGRPSKVLGMNVRSGKAHKDKNVGMARSENRNQRCGEDRRLSQSSSQRREVGKKSWV